MLLVKVAQACGLNVRAGPSGFLLSRTVTDAPLVATSTQLFELPL
jgi:hypothetical protein